MPKIKPQTLKNTKFFWARQVPTFPVHHHLVGSLSLDAPSTDKFLKEALVEMVREGNLSMLQNFFSLSCSKRLIFNTI